jgi:hypothetical protein
MVQQYIQNCDYLRPTEWVGGRSWAVNKVTISVNRTLLVDHLLEPFKVFARIDAPEENDLCRMTLAAAIESVEAYTRLTFNPREQLWAVRGWSHPNVLQIPYQPVQTLRVTDTAGVDITADCEVNSNVDDVMFYLRLPQGVQDADVTFGAGFYADPTLINIWTVLNVWHLLNAWSIPDAVIDEHPLLRHAILLTAADMYENRQSDTSQMRTAIPSMAEMVLRPIRRPVEF